jgi:small conductance mechanosensitive channel
MSHETEASFWFLFQSNTLKDYYLDMISPDLTRFCLPKARLPLAVCRARSLAVFFAISLLSFTLTLCWDQLALSQALSQKELQTFYQNQGIISSLKAQGQIGNLVYAPVTLDGKVLFLVAAPASLNQKKDDESLSPVEVRVQSIERKLQGILQRGFDPATLSVNASILNSQTVILVSDGKRLAPQPVLTVTDLDAQLHGRVLSDLAEEGAKYLREVLLQAWKERQPDYLRHQGTIAIAIILGLCLTSGLWLRLRRRLKSQWQRHKEHLAILTLSEGTGQPLAQSKAESDSLEAQAQKNELIEPQKNREHLKKQIRQINFVIWLFAFGILFLWLLGSSQILQLFPHTRELGQFVAQKPRELLLIWLCVFLANKGLELLISFLFREWKEEVEAKILFNRASARDLVRIATLADALRGVGAVLLLASGLIASLQRLGVPITPILAGAGIVGFAVSFGSQNFIKSMIFGASNLWLDAYAVGDSIVVENVAGTVENINLVFTQIRSIEGSLITIPNSRIEIIENKTRDWSQVNLSIPVAYDTDVDKALTAVRETGEELLYDPEWQPYILAPPDLLGIDTLEHTGMAVRLLLKTQPGLQWKVGRELRRRLRQRFEREGISIGSPKHTIALQSPIDLRNAKDR